MPPGAHRSRDLGGDGDWPRSRLIYEMVRRQRGRRGKRCGHAGKALYAHRQGHQDGGETKPGDRIGVSFSASGTPNVTVYVPDGLVINEANRVAGVVPELPVCKTWQIKIRARFSHSGTPLKETREIVSGFSVQMATARKTDEAETRDAAS